MLGHFVVVSPRIHPLTWRGCDCGICMCKKVILPIPEFDAENLKIEFQAKHRFTIVNGGACSHSLISFFIL